MTPQQRYIQETGREPIHQTGESTGHFTRSYVKWLEEYGADREYWKNRVNGIEVERKFEREACQKLITEAYGLGQRDTIFSMMVLYGELDGEFAQELLDRYTAKCNEITTIKQTIGDLIA